MSDAARRVDTGLQLVDRRRQPRRTAPPVEPSMVAAAYITIAALIGTVLLGIVGAVALVHLQDLACALDIGGGGNCATTEGTR